MAGLFGFFKSGSSREETSGASKSSKSIDPIELGLVDSRNRELWNSINIGGKVALEWSDDDFYAHVANQNRSTIRISKGAVDADSFTHEMLHILLRRKEVFLSGCLTNLISGDPVLGQVISGQLLNHFGNCMDHIKMLPLYQQMGFDVTKFTIDASSVKCNAKEIASLKAGFELNPLLPADAVDFYIGKFIAMKADAVPKEIYPHRYETMKELDPELFDVLEKTVTEWENMPIERKDVMDDDYRTVAMTFTDGLTEWLESKVIE